MWYAVWVRTGEEEKLQKICQNMIIDSQNEEACFLPKYERAWKIKGKWEKRQEILFPGYLFFATEKPVELAGKLKQLPEFAQLLGDEEGLIPLYKHEVAFFKKYTNDNYVLEMSMGFLECDRLVITEGALKDYEGKVVHIDRHRRLATLELEFFGRQVNMTVGVEGCEEGLNGGIALYQKL